MENKKSPQTEVYGNFHELLLVIFSFVTLAVYLHTGLSNTRLLHWIFFALLTALTIFNWAMLFNPIPKKGNIKPFWAYAKAYGFCCFLWLATFLVTGWKTVFEIDFIGILTSILCVFFSSAMFYGGTFILWMSRARYLIQLNIDEDGNPLKETENPWNIALNPVQNFTKPRYVYAGGYETEEPLATKSTVIGFRISPSLVLHSISVCYGFKRSDLQTFQKKVGGKLLNADDVKILRENWDKVSEMCKNAGRSPLPNTMFWYQNGECIEATHREEKFEGQNPEYCSIIMKL